MHCDVDTVPGLVIDIQNMIKSIDNNLVGAPVIDAAIVALCTPTARRS